MIQRRQFLGALTGCFAAGLAAGPVANRLLGNNKTDDLRWRCNVIQTVAHNRSLKKPVVTGVCLQPQGDLLAIVGDDHHVSLYDTVKQSYVEHLEAHTDWVRSTKFTQDGKTLITAGNDRTIYLWDTASIDVPRMSREHEAAVIEVAISDDDQLFATVGFEETLRVYDVRTGQVQREFRCPCKDNHAVAFSPGNKLIAAGGRSGTLSVWDLASGKSVVKIKNHRKRIRSIRFTPDSKVISAGDDQIVCITDTQVPDRFVAMPRHASKLYATELLDAGMFATAGSDNKIHVWQLSDLSEVGTLSGHTGTVSALDFANHRLVSGSYDTQVRIWHTQSTTSILEHRSTQATEGWNQRLN
ncbi:MAG: WD40 repeat domain-containing protein [Planctomycetota bacterium]